MTEPIFRIEIQSLGNLFQYFYKNEKKEKIKNKQKK